MTIRIVNALTLSFLCLSLAACGADAEEFGSDDGISLDEAGETGDQAEAGEEGDDTEGETGADACVNEGFELLALTPKVMLVLDKSGSMNQNTWDHDGDSGSPEVTRWSSLHGVVDGLTEQYADAADFGVTLFPAIDSEYSSNSFESSCRVGQAPDVGIGGSTAEILAVIPAAEDEDFSGATPATEGILTAGTHLESVADGSPAAMVLITDGAANCASADDYVGDYDESLEGAVADAWQGGGIPTYVVGIDIREDGGAVDVNPRDALDAVAHAGGVPNPGEVGFYDATNPDALETALDEITHRLGCQLELGFSDELDASVSIEIDGQTIAKVDSCGATDEAAWAQIDPDNNPERIELCNAACDQAEVTGGTATMCPVIP